MPAKIIINIRGIRVEHELKIGDLVLTYDGQLAKIQEIGYQDRFVAEVKLNNDDWVEPYQLTPIRRLGAQAKEVMMRRGRSRL